MKWLLLDCCNSLRVRQLLRAFTGGDWWQTQCGWELYQCLWLAFERAIVTDIVDGLYCSLTNYPGLITSQVYVKQVILWSRRIRQAMKKATGRFIVIGL